MLHVSFAMTTEAYSDRTKTETRRFWNPSHAAKFQPGVLFSGISKDFRVGGTRLHDARVIFCRRERLGDMTEDSFLREGGTRYWPNRETYIVAMGGPDLVPWVLRFEHVFEGFEGACDYCSMCPDALRAGFCYRGADMQFTQCGTTEAPMPAQGGKQ